MCVSGKRKTGHRVGRNIKSRIPLGDRFKKKEHMNTIGHLEMLGHWALSSEFDFQPNR